MNAASPSARLASARVLVVGMGGLGCPAAIALAHAGVGTIGIADDDEVDVTNLHRQILYRDEDVGRPKVPVAAAALQRFAARVVVEQNPTRLLPPSAVDLVSRYDLVVEGSDNFATKFLTADACMLARRPVVHGAAVRWHGTALVVGAEGGPCYRCLFEDVPRENAPNCAEAGVIGPMVGVVGALQADLAVGWLRVGDAIAGTLVTFDGKTLGSRRRRIAPRRSCALCGLPPRHPDRITDIQAARYAPAPCTT